MIFFKIVLMLFLSFCFLKAKADHESLLTNASNIHSVSSCLSLLESPIDEQEIPKILSSTTNLLNPIKDLIITFDGRVFWKEQEVIFKYNDDRTVGYDYRQNNSYRRSILNTLLTLTESPNILISAEEIYWDAFTHNDPEKHFFSLGSLKVLISNIKSSFLEVDPNFNHIVSKPNTMYAWDTSERYGVQSLGELDFHFGMQEVWWKGVKIPHLTLMEFNIIRTLFKKPNHPIRLTSLYDESIGSRYLTKNLNTKNIIISMQVMVPKIRSKFRAIDPNFSALKSIRAQSDEGPSLMLEIKKNQNIYK